jgi:hypothetical protein
VIDQEHLVVASKHLVIYAAHVLRVDAGSDRAWFVDMESLKPASSFRLEDAHGFATR